MLKYTSYIFIAPQPLTIETYEALKQKLNKDPNFQIGSSDEKFTSKFKNYFIRIGIGVAGCVLVHLFETFFKNFMGNLDWLGLVFGLIAFITFILLVIEGSTYGGYLTDKHNFFAKMKWAIQVSKDFEDYNQLFNSK